MTTESLLRLSVSEVATSSLLERAFAFRAVASIANAGGSGLIRMAGEGLNEEVRTLFEQGKDFLLQVKLDAEQYLYGVEVRPDTTGIETHYGSNFRYHPGEVFWGIATGYQDETIPKQYDVDRIVKEIDRKATELLLLFKEVLQGKMPTKEEIGELLKRYVHLSAPYLVMSQRATGDLMRRRIPANIERIYGT